jgi:hypothetical protein
MFNLSPEEDPYAEWFHANVLTVRGGHLTIEKSPRYISKGEVYFSASDGAFYTFQGDILTVGRRTIVAMLMTACDYCVVPIQIKEDPESKLATEYIAKYFKDGSFEIDHVRYRRQKDAHYEPKPEH